MKINKMKGVSAGGGVWFYATNDTLKWVIAAAFWWLIIFISAGLIFLHLPMILLSPIVAVLRINQVNN